MNQFLSQIQPVAFNLRFEQNYSAVRCWLDFFHFRDHLLMLAVERAGQKNGLWGRERSLHLLAIFLRISLKLCQHRLQLYGKFERWIALMKDQHTTIKTSMPVYKYGQQINENNWYWNMSYGASIQNIEYRKEYRKVSRNLMAYSSCRRVPEDKKCDHYFLFIAHNLPFYMTCYR